MTHDEAGHQHQHIHSELDAMPGELECLRLTPWTIRGDGQRASPALLNHQPRELAHLSVGKIIEAAVAVGKQASTAAARDAGHDDVADSAFVEVTVARERRGNGVHRPVEEGFD